MTRPGFSLLEAVVALVIVGTASAAAYAAFAADAGAASGERASAPAVAIATEQMAQLQLLDAHTLLAIPDSLRRGQVAVGATGYEWHADARAVPTEYGLYELAIDVRWKTGTYALRTRTYRAPMTARLGVGTP